MRIRISGINEGKLYYNCFQTAFLKPQIQLMKCQQLIQKNNFLPISISEAYFNF